MPGIYVASKTKHADKWKVLRDQNGWPICSTWIDEAGKGETICWSELWLRCIWEVRTAERVIFYCEPGEHHKGSLVEVGVALSSLIPVILVGENETLGSWPNHPSVVRASTLVEAAQMPVHLRALNQHIQYYESRKQSQG